MSKLYFRYGAMNCGKSSALMQVAYNYEQNNKKVIVIKSEIDTKGNNYLESRIGLKRKVDILLKENESIEKYDDKLTTKLEDLPSCEDFKPTDIKYQSLWESIFVKPLAWLILKLGYLKNACFPFNKNFKQYIF